MCKIRIQRIFRKERTKDEVKSFAHTYKHEGFAEIQILGMSARGVGNGSEVMQFNSSTIGVERNTIRARMHRLPKHCLSASHLWQTVLPLLQRRNGYPRRSMWCGSYDTCCLSEFRERGRPRRTMDSSSFDV